MKNYVSTIILAIILTTVSACNMKAPEDTHQEQAAEANGKMAQAKANLEDATKKAEQMRLEAARLRMSGNSEDTEKAAKLESEAARLESNALNNLNPGLH